MGLGETRTLYQKVAEAVKERIDKGLYAPGDALPTERELEVEFGVSRVTVRAAISKLQEMGYLRKEQGRGTFVTTRKLSEKVGTISSFTLEMTNRGHKVSTRNCKVTLEPASAEIADKLSLQEGQPVVVVDRVRCVEDEPISISITYIPQKLVPGLVETGLVDESLYKTLEERYGLELYEARQSVWATLPKPKEAKALGISETTPVLRITRLTVDRSGQPIEYGKVIYRGDMYSYDVVLRGR